MRDRADASPAKDFFISMITRDITLEDCVLDLVDNSVDGARRPSSHAGEANLAGFEIKLSLGGEEFSIRDNCGGISVSDAKNYAFHFGRRRDTARSPVETIGVYGIGMKRAVFKLGRDIKIQSSTRTESFSAHIEVDEWGSNPDWNIPIDIGGPLDVAGTAIVVGELNEGVGKELTDPAFVKRLVRALARGYALFLRQGLAIHVNDAAVTPEYFELLVGGDFEPAKQRYDDDGVAVEIVAGMAASPPVDDSPDAKIPHYHTYGWYVVCNDRVVLAGDKSHRTIWGDDNFNLWHNQYNGFLGVVSFHSSDPSKLPWTTTKRDLDVSHPVYRRAVVRMKTVTRPFIEYTNVKKDQEARATELEKVTKKTPLSEIPEREQMKVPAIEKDTRIPMRNVLYRKPEDRLKAAAEALGNRNLAFKEVGSQTFEYYFQREVGKA